MPRTRHGKRRGKSEWRFEVWLYKGYHKDLLEVFDDLDEALKYVKKWSKAIDPYTERLKLYAVRNKPTIWGGREYWHRELIPWRELLKGG